MKRFIAAALPVLFICLSASYATAADAFAFFGNEKPLAIIRLHTPNMQYKTALDRAIKAVLAAKKDATFTIAGGYANGDDVWKNAAQQHIFALTSSLRANYGVAPERVHSMTNSSGAIARAELRIYVD